MSQLYLWQAQELELTRKKGPGLIGMGLAKAEAGALFCRIRLYSAFCQPHSGLFSILEIRPYSYFCQPHFHARHGRALFLVSSEIERTRNKAQSLPERGWQKAE